MIGAYAQHGRAFLLAWAILTAALFALPMIFAPLAWARAMRFQIPAHTDLAVYYGRCLGVFAFVLDAMMSRAAMTGIGTVFVFDVGLAFSALMVPVHVYGAVRRIQPMTETVEIAFWAGAVSLFLLFFPITPAT
jgi:hypothetical protein